MSHKVIILIQHEDNAVKVQSIVDYLQPVVSVDVQKRDEEATKSWNDSVGVVLTIIGGWAAERYILNPLADTAQKWLASIRTLWEQKKHKSRVQVSIIFDDNDGAFTIKFSSTNDERILLQVWDLAKQAGEILQVAKQNGISLTEIVFFADGTDKLLIVGYQNEHAKCTIDLAQKKLKLYPDSIDIDAEIWILSQLLRHQEYLQALIENGYEVNSEEASASRMEIQSRKQKLLN